MALVLGATGVFLHVRLRADLDSAIEAALRSRAGDVSALVQQADTGLRDAAVADEGPGAQFAQILDARGRVFDATPGLERSALLAPAELRGALRRTTGMSRVHAQGFADPMRLLAVPVRAQDQRLVIVVGAPLTARDQALANLATLLVIGGAAALLLTSLAGYGLASAALRPVESMRRRAESISGDRPSARLPLSSSRDELHRLGRTLNDMLARLEDGLERQRAFTAEAGHELRTPLTMLRTELDLLARDRPTGKQLDEAVGSALDEADRLAALIGDLLTLARSDSGVPALELGDVVVADLLASVQARWARLGAPQQIHVDTAPGLIVRADPARVAQALGNLVGNALRHGRPPIRITGERHGDLAELHVRDAGDGFSPDFAGRAFDRFARADHRPVAPEPAAAGGSDGAGLGLAIVQAIARAHGGDAHIGVDAGGGADVWIALPVDGPPDEGPAHRRERRSGRVQHEAGMLHAARPAARPAPAPPGVVERGRNGGAVS
jgi:signal transduction histidine kinase